MCERETEREEERERVKIVWVDCFRYLSENHASPPPPSKAHLVVLQSRGAEKKNSNLI